MKPKIEFEQVKRVRIYEEIVEQLKDFFARGKLKPGDKLPSERDLAEQFNCSRGSVRQALTLLEAQGLLVRKVGEGTYKVSEEDFEVSQLVNLLIPKKGELNEPLEVRRLIEPTLAGMAAERATPEDITAIEDCLVLQQAKVEADELIISEDNEFHYAIAKATNNGIFVKLVEAINDMLLETRETSLKAEQGGQRSLKGHRQILDAIKKRDSNAAYRAMQKHLEEVEGLVTSYVEKQYSNGESETK